MPPNLPITSYYQISTVSKEDSVTKQTCPNEVSTRFRTPLALPSTPSTPHSLNQMTLDASRTLTGWGNCLNQMGRFDEALNLQLQAAQACASEPEQHGDAQSIVLLNLGYVYFRRGDLQKAEDTLLQAQKLDEKLQPVPYALANLAILRGEIEYGLKLHREALKLYVAEFGEQHHCVADSLFKVGETYLKLSLISEAVVHLHKSLAMYRSEGQHFDARAAISRGARMLAMALQHLPSERSGRVLDADWASPGDLLEEAFDLHMKLTGRRGSMSDTDDDYSSLMFYWSR